MEETSVYIGLDLHKETIFGTALDKEGNILFSHRFQNNKEALQEFLKPFHPSKTSIAVEACGFWRSCHFMLRSLGFQAVLANPLKCHQIAKDKKTDKRDSEIIADLSRANYLPRVYLPSDDIISLRDTTRHRCSLAKERKRFQIRIKSYLRREGIQYAKDLWNKKGIMWLESLENEKISDLLDIYSLLCQREKSVIKKLKKRALKREISLLMTIPGIGVIGSTLIYAEIGDISRFGSYKQLHAYSGVAPGIYQSGDTSREVRRKEVNKWLKWIVLECTGRAIMLPNEFRDYYLAIIKRGKSEKIARRATARKMLVVVWHILKEQVPYHDS
jgi:transposase